MHRNILIVDDEPVQAKLFERFVKDMDHNIIIMNSGRDVIDFFLNKKSVNNVSTHDIDVMLLDLSMPDIDGLTVLKQIAPIKGDLQVIVLTASSDISLAINAINLGAIDYIVKGEKDVYARVIASINNAIEKRNLKYQVSNLERKGRDQVVFSDIIGKSDGLINAINLSKKVINSTVPVLIEGPVGSGKELLARAIHGSGAKVGKPFVAVDCETLKPGSIDNVLFGYERTLENGSVEKSMGRIREANGGTLFLDNVSTLKTDTQIKLLHFIQEGEVEAVGSKTTYKVSVRIVSSTSRDLKALVKEGRFREELYYRLSVFPITLPSLKERGPEDIKLLSENFCRNFSTNENKKIRGISDEAMQLLINYDWEDNVRQLKNYIFRAVVLCDDEFLKPEHFPQIINMESNNRTKAKSIIKSSTERGTELIDIFDDEGRCKSLDEIEEEVVQRLVEFYNNNLSEVSKQLKVGRSTVYRKLKIDSSKLDNNPS